MERNNYLGQVGWRKGSKMILLSVAAYKKALTKGLDYKARKALALLRKIKGY